VGLIYIKIDKKKGTVRMRCIRRLLYEEGLYLECPVIVFVCLLYHCVFKEVWGGQYMYMGRHSSALLLKPR